VSQNHFSPSRACEPVRCSLSGDARADDRQLDHAEDLTGIRSELFELSQKRTIPIRVMAGLVPRLSG
jgi:hypothetical protein